MEIKRFVDSINDFYNLSKSEQIAYFTYYLSEIEDDGTFFQKDVRSCFTKLNLDLTINLSGFFSKNSKGKNKLFINKNKKGYSLELKTRKAIEKKLNLVENSNINDSDKIIFYSFTNVFYKKLLEEINRTYHHDCCTATFILIRKLFENFLIDILRKNFKKEKELYLCPYNKKKYNDFSVLLNNLNLKKGELGFTTTEIKTIIDLLNPYRIEANSKTHSIIEFGQKKDLQKYKPQETFNLLERLWNN